MIEIDGKVISRDLFTEHFLCDLSACKGACCVEGESGAPLTDEEVGLLPGLMDKVRPYMREEGKKAIREQGTHVIDKRDGEAVTPLVEGRECAFVNFDGHGIAKCAFELAYRDGKTGFPKPVSCHLYPVRVTRYSNFEAVNYHKWTICNPAKSCGLKQKVKVYRFLRVALVRKYGEGFYRKLGEAERLVNGKS